MNILALSLTALLVSPSALARAEEGDEHLRGAGGRGLVSNGTPASDSDYPSHVRVLQKGTNFPICGGTLIGDRVVLTAKHCEDFGDIGAIAVKWDSREFFKVDTDTAYVFDKKLPGLQTAKHPDLDLMLLKVEGNDITANGRTPASIRRDTTYVGGFMAGVEVNIAGGGITDHTDVDFDCLATGFNKADIEVRDCPSGWDSNTVLCAYNRGSRLCSTDSGTGVFQKQWQTGWFGTGVNVGGDDVLVGVVGNDYEGNGNCCDALVGPGAGDTMGLCNCAKTFSSLVRIGTNDVINWIVDAMENDFGVSKPDILENGSWPTPP